MSCPDCKGTNLYFNDNALCLLCSDCGNVVESNQSVLDFSMTTEKGTGTNFGMGRSFYSQPSTMVARSGRHINNGTKEARWHRNLETAKSFLEAVTRNMHQSGCTERAQYILEQAMRKGRHRWGGWAERVAGASICIALREAGKAETVREVAIHIQCREDQLARTYRHLISLLGMKLDPLDPALLVPAIWNYTQSCLTTSYPSGKLPSELITFLNDLIPQTRTILNLALQLSNLILRVSLTQGRQPPLVACALLIVSLSGEAGKPIPKPTILYSTLSARFGGTSRSIADRVREIERVIEDWRLELPWAQSDVPPNQRKRTTKIAHLIKDVIHFKDDLWSKQIEAVEHARYSPSTDDPSEDEADDMTSCTGSVGIAGSKRSSARTSSTSGGKRRYIDAGYYDSGRPRAYVVESSKNKGGVQAVALAGLLNPETTDFVLASAAKVKLMDELQRVPTSKPVRDEDLFEEDELEGLIRSAPEVEALQARWDQERRFEGVPEWSDTPKQAVLELGVAAEDEFLVTMDELFEEWREVSPSGIDDSSYFYEE